MCSFWSLNSLDVQVAQEIWVCDHRTISRYTGEIRDFKMQLRHQMHLDGDAPYDQKKASTFLVPLAPPRSISAPLPVPIVPPKPPAEEPLKTPAPAAISEQDEIMKAREQLAALSMKKRSTEETKPSKAETAKENVKKTTEKAPTVAAPAEESVKTDTTGQGEDKESAMDEKTRLKLKKQAEKEAAAARAAELEVDRLRRKAEKEADLEEARKLRQAEEIAREQRALERAEKNVCEFIVRFV